MTVPPRCKEGNQRDENLKLEENLMHPISPLTTYCFKQVLWLPLAWNQIQTDLLFKRLSRKEIPALQMQANENSLSSEASARLPWCQATTTIGTTELEENRPSRCRCRCFCRQQNHCWKSTPALGSAGDGRNFNRQTSGWRLLCCLSFKESDKKINEKN